MTPDSDTYQHILLNAALWYVVFFGHPTVRWLFSKVNRRVDQRINLHVHAALHPNVTVLHDQSGRSA